LSPCATTCRVGNVADEPPGPVRMTADCRRCRLDCDNLDARPRRNFPRTRMLGFGGRRQTATWRSACVLARSGPVKRTECRYLGVYLAHLLVNRIGDLPWRQCTPGLIRIGLPHRFKSLQEHRISHGGAYARLA